VLKISPTISNISSTSLQTSLQLSPFLGLPHSLFSELPPPVQLLCNMNGASFMGRFARMNPPYRLGTHANPKLPLEVCQCSLPIICLIRKSQATLNF